MIFTTAHAYLLFFSNLGRVYRLKAHEIPKKERTARGTPIVNLLPLQPAERDPGHHRHPRLRDEPVPVLRHPQGQVKKTTFNEYDSSLRGGLIAINLRDGDELVKVIPTEGGDDIFMVSRGARRSASTRTTCGRWAAAAAGVRGMKLRAATRSSPVDVARDDAAILIVTDAGYGKRTQLEHFNRQGRGGQGVKASSSPPRRATSSPPSWSASTTRSS